MYVGMRYLNKPVTMIRYPREPHWMHEYEHHKDLLTECSPGSTLTFDKSAAAFLSLAPRSS